MGRFSTTVHIKDNAGRMKVINSFCEVMKKRGFVQCSEDEAALSYLLAFGEGGWVTLANEEYKDNPQKAYDDSRETVAALKTSTFSVEVVDSDFALLKLSDPNGGEDEVVVGDGSGYGIEDAPKGDKKLWEPLLAEGRSWEQFSETAAKNEVFVEDVLAELAGVLGIEPYYIDADFDEVSDKADENKNITAFYFKKADEKKKSMTLNAAFIKVFGEGLEPYGFKRLKKIKNKQPYYVRVINGELLHIVTYRQVSSNKLHYKCIEVLVGVVSLYRRNLDFLYYADDPDICLSTPIRYFGTFNIDVDKSVMDSAIQFDCDIWGDSFEHRKKTYYYGPSTDPKILYKSAFSWSIRDFLCKADDADEMLACMNNAFNSSKAVFLPFFDIVSDIRTFVDYLFRGYLKGMVGLSPLDKFIEDKSDGWSEGLTLIKAGYRYDGNEEMKENLAQYLSRQSPNTPQEKIEELRRQYEQRHEEQLALRLEMLDNPELNKRVMEELERCKAKNIEALKSYGISLGEDDNITAPYLKKAAAKAKSMSLNAAFKKVFGEALEPLGYKLIKSKYPYFVKVANEEIIHYVTVANETADGRGYNGVRYKCFNVFCGVSTVYNGDIDFNENHAKFHSNFIDSISEIYTRTHWSNLDMKYRASIMRFYYNPTDNNSLMAMLKKVLAVVEMYALPVIGQAVTLEKCMDYFGLMNHLIYPFLGGGDEGLLCTKLFSADEFVIFKDKYCERELEGLKRELSSNPDSKRRATLEERIEYIMRGREEGKKQCYDFFINPELQEKAPAELERRKKENTEKLRSYGLDL